MILTQLSQLSGKMLLCFDLGESWLMLVTMRTLRDRENLSNCKKQDITRDWNLLVFGLPEETVLRN